MGQTNTPPHSARYAHRSADFTKLYDSNQSSGGKHESIYK